MGNSRTKHTVSPSAPQLPESMVALASGMADDFNNILTTVMGACSLLDKDTPANSELIQYIDAIRSSAERAAVLSDKLADISTRKPDSDRSGCQSAVSKPGKVSRRDKKFIDDIVFSNKNPGGASS